MRRTYAVLLTMLAVAVVSCGGTADSSGPPAAGAPSPTPTRPSCTGPDEGMFSVARNSSGAERGGFLVLGRGERGVLLVPQSKGDICQWLPTGRQLAAAGYRVGLMEWTTPFDTAVTTAAGLLRSAGATRVVLVGASRGGAYVIGVAAGLRPPPAGVVSFSGEGRLGDWDAHTRIRSYRGPLLLLGSEQDRYTPGAVTRLLAEDHPGPETVLVTPGGLHGVDLLIGPYADQVDAAFRGFLARTLS